jgi:hypothetical protein
MERFETKREEHARLRQRTSELMNALAVLQRKPFKKADFEAHIEALRQHRAALARHRRRSDES